MQRHASEVRRNRCGGDPGCVYTKSKMAANNKFRDIEPSWRSRVITAIALHPGYTKTDMSPRARQTARFSATSIRKLSERLTPADAGKFFNFNGQTLPW